MSEEQYPEPVPISDHDPDHDHDESCMDVINDALSEQSGIINVALDTAGEKITFDYDPLETDGSKIFQIAQDLGPILHDRWNTCTMRLDRRGGRACESCALALENRVQRIPGVRRATASYFGGVLSVNFDEQVISSDELKGRIQQMGVPVSPSAIDEPFEAAALEEPEGTVGRVRQRIQRRHVETVFVVIAFVAMISGLIADLAFGLTTLSTVSYVIAYITGGYFGLRAGLASLRQGKIDVDVLMVLAALGAAFVGAAFEGAMLLFLFSLSNILQLYALDRTRSAIRSLMNLRPTEAMVKRGDQIITLPIEKVNIGDRFICRPGERVPLDGVVVEGSSTLDQSPLTGESMPVSKNVGDTVLAGTINLHGGIEVGVTRMARDTTIAKMIQLVEEAQSEKAQTQRTIDRVEQFYATGVVLVTVLAIVIPVVLLGEAFGSAFFRAMALMVAASPCALVISTPATVLSAIGNGARNGVLFKGGAYVEQVAAVKVVAFDKTGTLTEGRPVVTDIIPLINGVVADQANKNGKLSSEQEALLWLAATIENRSEHPLARSIVNKAKEQSLELGQAASFKAAPGLGVRATINGDRFAIGNQRFLRSEENLDLSEAEATIMQLQSEGKTSILVAQSSPDAGENKILGILAISDVLRSDAAEVIRQLKQIGVEHVVMLTGDN
jgi:Cd2+/Zn2+-exporting ATPase